MRRQNRPIRQLKRLAIVLGAFALLLLTIYLAIPTLVSRLAPQFAERLGFETIEVSMGYPGQRGLKINRLKLVSSDYLILGENARLRYTIPTLLNGRVESIVFEFLGVSISSTSTNEAEPTTTTKQLFPALPFNHLRIEQLTLEFPDTDFMGKGQAELGDGLLAFSLQGIKPEAASHFNITASLSSEGIFDARFGERDDVEAEFLTIHGAINEHVLEIAGQFDLRDYVLDLGSSIAGLPAGTGAITGQFDSQLAWPLAETLSWQDITAALPIVSIDWTSADGQLELKELAGSMVIDRGHVTALVSGAIHTQFDDYDLDFTLPTDYQLTYQTHQVLGEGSLDLNASGPDQTLVADIRSFSIDTAAGARITLDAVIEASTLELLADGSFKGNLNLTTLEPAQGDGRFDFTGNITASSQPYASTIETTFNIAGDDLSATGQLTAAVVEQAPFELLYNLRSGAGSLSVTDSIDFNQPLAAAVIPNWSETYDLDSGQMDATLELSWRSFDEVMAELALTLTSGTGHYDSYQANGVDSELSFRATDVGDGETWRLLDSSVQLGQVNVGVPVSDLDFEVAWSGDRAHVKDVSATLLGGQATATDFVYNLAAGTSSLILNLQNLDLAEVLALEGDDILGTGRLNGSLPVIINNNQVSINGGTMAAAPPGGTIRLTPSITGPSGQPGLDFALLALKDFNYSELNTEINYAENGDLQLAVHLKGRNPAVEDGRPIHYNLNITENVPVLLESLRLQDQVTERIEAEAKK